ncbi:MAG: hypothetical protein AB1810_09620 [Pseudomonadota bacterium]
MKGRRVYLRLLAVPLSLILSLSASHAAGQESGVTVPAEAEEPVEVYEYMTAPPVQTEPEFIGTGPFIWFEPSWGPGSIGITEGFKFKYGREQQLYGIEFSTTKDYCSHTVDCPMDKNTGESFSQEYSEINLLVGYRWFGRFYHFSGDVGLGYLSGKVTDECTPTSIRKIELCEKSKIGTLAVPVDFTLLFGKYFGAGINFHATVSPDIQLYSISMIFAFGNFN